ncbi:alpha/beta hydrolase [Levilactobacillus brevis]|nr:alpha/beta hydrolase [Levilactobacillus brevis]
MSLRGKWLLFKTQHSQLKQQIQQAFLQPSRQNRAVIPEKFATSIVTKERQIFGGRLLTAATGAPLPQHVLLFHGGAYTMQGIDSHRELMETLIQQANLRVTYVDYPLVPEATVDETGGGLALTLLQQLAKHQEPMPAGTILVSPWTDLSMMNPDLTLAAKRDPYLTLATLKKIGFDYAGDHPVTDPVVSPIYGNFDNLGPVLLYYGTNELLPFQAHQMPSMLHDYILWRKLPETKQTLAEIKQFILTGEL